MPSVVPPAFLNFIKTGEKFLVAGHKDPDADCVGSQLALASVLRRMGKTAILCSAGPFKRVEVKAYERFFVSSASAQDRAGARAIFVDCSAPDRSGDLEPFLEGLPRAAVDHHETGPFAALAADPAEGPFYVDSRASAAAALILKTIEALGLAPEREEAELLFFGLCADTGFFRHVDSGGAETFELAARLIRAGANPKAAFLAINGGKSLDSRRLLGRILARAESFFGGKLILSSEDFEESRAFGLEGRDSDSLYQLLQTVAGVEAVALIRQESPEKCSIGFRSRDRVDVGAVAESFGGGGHKNAAGCSARGTVGELAPKIIQAFEKYFLPRS